MGDDFSPPLLANMDITTILWAALWATLLGLSKISRTRQQQDKDSSAPITSWWAVIFDSLLGSLLGGVLAALVVPSWFPEWHEPGRIALLSVAGAAVGPYISNWAVQVVVQLVAFFSERKIGVKIELKNTEGGVKDNDHKTDS